MAQDLNKDKTDELLAILLERKRNTISHGYRCYLRDCEFISTSDMPLSSHLETTHSLSKELQKIDSGERALTEAMIALLQADARRKQQIACVIDVKKKQAVGEVLPIERAMLRKEETELEVQRLYCTATAAPIEEDVKGFLDRDYGRLFELKKMSREENEVGIWAYWTEHRDGGGVGEGDVVEAEDTGEEDESDGDEDYEDDGDD